MEISRDTLSINAEVIEGLKNNNAYALELLKALITLKTGKIPTKTSCETFDNNTLVSFALPDNTFCRLSISDTGIDIIVSEYKDLQQHNSSNCNALEALADYPEICKSIYEAIVSKPEESINRYLKLFESITKHTYTKYSYTVKDNFIAIGLANNSDNESLIMIDSNGKLVYHSRDYN